MTKLGFQLNYVHQSIGKKKCRNEFLIPHTLRLDEEVKMVVENPLSLSGRLEIISRPNFPNLLERNRSS